MSSAIMIQNSFWGRVPAISQFSPSDLDELNQWYTPTHITASSVIYWQDESNNGHDLHTTIGTATTGSLNGYSTVKIDLSTAMLGENNSSTINSKPTQTYAIVIKPTYNIVVFDYGNTFSKAMDMVYSGSNEFYVFMRDSLNTSIKTDAVPATSGSWNIIIGVYNSTEKRAEIYNNLGNMGTGSNASFITSTTWEGTARTHAKQSWACIGTTTYNEFQGNHEFAEMIVYQNTRSLAEINQLGNYLADKFGLSWTNF